LKFARKRIRTSNFENLLSGCPIFGAAVLCATRLLAGLATRRPLPQAKIQDYSDFNAANRLFTCEVKGVYRQHRS
jgi:hypothetical protein